MIRRVIKETSSVLCMGYYWKHDYCVKLLSLPQKRDGSWMCLYYTKLEEVELGAEVEGTMVMLILQYSGIPLEFSSVNGACAQAYMCLNCITLSPGFIITNHILHVDYQYKFISFSVKCKYPWILSKASLFYLFSQFAALEHCGTYISLPMEWLLSLNQFLEG